MSATLMDCAAALARQHWDSLLTTAHKQAYEGPEAEDPLPWCRGERTFLLNGIISSFNLASLACAQAGSRAGVRDARLAAIEARLTAIEKMLEGSGR